MGLFDHLFKPKPEGNGEAGVEGGIEGGESAQAVGVASEEAGSHFLHPKERVPRSANPVIPGQRAGGAALTVARRAPTTSRRIAPEGGANVLRQGIVLTVGDVLGRIPPQFVRPAPHDLKRELRFRPEQVVTDFGKGKSSVALSSIAELCPDLFLRGITDDEDLEIRLPLQKVVEQITRLQPASGTGLTPAPASSSARMPSEAAPPMTLAHAAPLRAAPSPALSGLDEHVSATPAPAAPALAPGLGATLVEASKEAAATESSQVPLPLPPAPLVAPEPPKLFANFTPPPVTLPLGKDANSDESVGPAAPESAAPIQGDPAAGFASEPPPAEPILPLAFAPPVSLPKVAHEPALLSSSALSLPPPRPGVPLDFSKSLARHSASDEWISLALSAVLPRVPQQLVTVPLPAADGVNARIRLPFGLVERQLGSGRVEITAEMFVASLPAELQPSFAALDGVKVSLPLEEIFQNLPVSSRSPSAENISPALTPPVEEAQSRAAHAGTHSPLACESGALEHGPQASLAVHLDEPPGAMREKADASISPPHVSLPPLGAMTLDLPNGLSAIGVDSAAQAAAFKLPGEAAQDEVPPAGHSPRTPDDPGSLPEPVSAPEPADALSATERLPEEEREPVMDVERSVLRAAQPSPAPDPTTERPLLTSTSPMNIELAPADGELKDLQGPIIDAEREVPSVPLVAPSPQTAPEVVQLTPLEPPRAEVHEHRDIASAQVAAEPMSVPPSQASGPSPAPAIAEIAASAPPQAAANVVLQFTDISAAPASDIAPATITVAPPIFRPAFLPPPVLASAAPSPPQVTAPTLSGPKGSAPEGSVSLGPVPGWDGAAPASDAGHVSAPAQNQAAQLAAAALSITAPPQQEVNAEMHREIAPTPNNSASALPVPTQVQNSPADGSKAEGFLPIPEKEKAPEPQIEKKEHDGSPNPISPALIKVGAAETSAPKEMHLRPEGSSGVNEGPEIPGSCHLHLPPLPHPAPSEGGTGHAPMPALPLTPFDQNTLQSLFLTDEVLDLEKICLLAGALPGVQACVITADGRSFTGGILPEGFSVAALRGLAPQVGAAADRLTLGALKNFTLYGDHYSVSFFERSSLCLCAIHRSRSFVPGVREKLVAVADELARV